MFFEAPDPGGLHWSQARRKRFNFCPAGYYLYHLAARDGYAALPGSREFRLYCAKFMMPVSAWGRGLFRKTLRRCWIPGGNPRRLPFAMLVWKTLERDFFRLERGEHHIDPKLAQALLEVEHGFCTLSAAYDRLCGELRAMLENFYASGLAETLDAVDPTDFRNRADEPVAFALGQVTLQLMPDLVWRDRDRLRVLDLTVLRSDEEENRLAALYLFWSRKCCSVAPERVKIEFYDVGNGLLRGGGVGRRDLTRLYRDLAGEAAMWRDYLIAAASDKGAAVLNRYARREQCRFCRFAGLCPAEHEA